MSRPPTLDELLVAPPTAATFRALTGRLGGAPPADRAAFVERLRAQIDRWADAQRVCTLEFLDPANPLRDLFRHLVLPAGTRARAARSVARALSGSAITTLSLPGRALLRGFIRLPAVALAGHQLSDLRILGKDSDQALLDASWWGRLVAHPALDQLSRLELRAQALDAASLETLRPLLARLRGLALRGVRLPEPTGDLLALLRHSPGLRQLELQGHALSERDVALLGPTLPPQLERLGLVECDLDDDAALELVEHIGPELALELKGNHLRHRGRQAVEARGRVSLELQSLEPNLLALLNHPQLAQVDQGLELLQAAPWRKETLQSQLTLDLRGRLGLEPLVTGPHRLRVALWLFLRSDRAPTAEALDLSRHSGAALASLPAGDWSRCRALWRVNLTRQQLTALPDALWALPALRQLQLSGNQLQTVPTTLLSGGRLEVLELAGNRFTAVPAALSQLPALRRLDLAWNRGLDPAGVSTLARLEQLDLRGCGLKTLPPLPGSLTSLTLDSNPLEVVPEAIRALPLLSRLSLNRCRIGQLPEWLVDLEQLRRLHLDRNDLAALPSLPAGLQVLSASHNRITLLPDGLLGPSLLQLDLCHNLLLRLPAEFHRATRLTRLQLADNRLLDLPPHFAMGRKLVLLDLSRNGLRQSGVARARARGALTLHLQGNPGLKRR